VAQPPRDLTPQRDARSFFGAELRHWRELRGFSQDRLGKEVHVSGDTVAKIEKASRWPRDEFASTCDLVLDTGGALGRLWVLVDGERRQGQGARYPGGARVLAPPPPPGVVARAEMVDRLVDRLLPPASSDAGPTGEVVAVCGPGGFGKTTVASLVCADPRVADTFAEVLWIETGEHCAPARLTGLVSDLCRHLGEPGVPFDDPEQAGFHLASVLSGRSVLLVVDNVWSAADLGPFLAGAAGGALLVTSRNARTCPAHAQVLRVDPMAIQQTEQLLTHSLPDGSNPQLRGLARRCGGWPLLAAVVGSSLRQDVESGTSLQVAAAAAASALDTVGPGAFDVWDADQRSTAIGEVLGTSLASLETNVRLPGGTRLRERYLCLGIFPAATAIPVDLLAGWWSRAEGWTPEAARQFCRSLVDRSLAVGIPGDRDAIALHDVFRSWLRHQAADRLPAWHASLLDAHRPASTSWADLDHRHRYLWSRLAYHLHEAALDRELIATLADPDFMVNKTIDHGPDSLAADRTLLDTVAPTLPEEKTAAETAKILTGSAYLLSGLTRPADVAGTMLVACLRERADRGATSRLAELAMSGEPAVHVAWAQPGLSDQNTQPGRYGHVGAITAVVVHRDRMVSAGEDGLLLVWDLRTGELARARRGHTGWVYAVAFSPDGQLIATAGDDGLVRIWHAQTADPVTALIGHQRRVRALVFSPSGRLLLSGGEDGQVRVWDVESRRLSHSFQTPGVPVWSLAIDSTGSVVAAGGEDQTLRLYDVGDGRLLDSAEADTDWVRVTAFAPDRPHLVSSSGDGPIRYWDASDQTLVPMGDQPAVGRVRCAAITAEGTVIAGTEDARLLALPATPDQPARTVPPLEGVDWIRAVAIASDGRVVAGCEDGALRRWDPAGGAALQVLAEGTNTTWSTALLGARGLTFHGRGDGLIDVCDLTSGNPREQLTVGKGRVWSLDARAHRIAATCGDTVIRMWDADGLAPLIDLDTHAGRTWAVALNQTGTRLAASSADGTVRVWDLGSGERASADLVMKVRAHTGRIRSLAFDGTGKWLATAGGEGIARVWAVADSACTAEFVSNGGWVRCVCLDATAQRLAIGDGPGDLHVYDVASRQTEAVLEGHNGRVLMLAIGADPDVLVSAAADGTVRAWSISRSRQLVQVRVDASLNCAAFDTDTAIVLAGSANGTTAVGVPDVVGRREDPHG
jgi:WD40 repeat protein/DNA-binding XRE family transcriptional regulator